MSRFQRIRRQALSLRGGIAVAGAIAVALGLTQSAGTLAAPELERTAKVPIASANYYPTPLTANVRCETNAPWYNLVAGRRADVSWDAVPGATGYILELVQWNSSNPDEVVRRTHNVNAPTTSVTEIRDSGRDVLYARVRTVNGPAVSSGYATPPQRISFKTYINGQTECENTGHPTLPNQGWENSQNWTPGVQTFGIGQPLVNALRGNAPEAVGAEDELSADATLDEAVAETSEAEAPEARSAEATTATTSTFAPAPRTSSAVSTTTPPTQRTSVSSSSPAAPSTTAGTSTPSRTTSTTVPATATPVALPGGGAAEIVSGTTLQVTDSDGLVCTAKVREGSTLTFRSGELEVTDAAETRVVDPASCRMS